MNDYDACVEIFTDALDQMGKQGIITKSEILPTPVDFTASIAIAIGGEEALKACIIRMGRCVEKYNKGTFPVRTN